MQSNVLCRKAPVLKFLSTDQIKEIHCYALELLEETGVLVYHDEAMELLAEAGATIEGRIVRIPETLVKQALLTVPSRIVMANRKGERCMFLESTRSYFGTGSGCPYTIDPISGERRDTDKRDIANAARLCDALMGIDFVMSSGLVRHQHPAIGYIHEFDAMVRSTVKPIIISAFNGANVRNIIGMAQTVMGGSDELRKKPLMAVYSEATAPLRHSEDGLDKLLVCAEQWVPIIHTVGILSGATGPVTLAGSLIQGNAELLSALVIHQLKNPGAPFFYGGTITPMDMRTMVHPYGAPEFHVLSAALTEMGAYYKIPVFSTGGCSDAKSFDQQASAEAIYSLLMAALSGANLIHDIGYIDSGLTSSLPQMVFADETIGLIKHILRGIPFAPADKAMEAIINVGPGGHFMEEQHTYDNFKRIFSPGLSTRQPYDAWFKKGARNLGQVIEERVNEILLEHEPTPLSEGLSKELDSMIKGFEMEAGRDKQ